MRNSLLNKEEKMEIPVYIVTGFLESGKTSFVMDTLQDEEFIENERLLLIACEEGIEEYDEITLKHANTNLVLLEEESDLTEEFLLTCQKKYKPSRVLVEYNGTWKMDQILEMKLPKDWIVVQIITTINAKTFESYMNNMRSIMADHFTNADMVIFNRCDESTVQSYCRRNVKAVNRRAQIYFELEDGSPAELEEEELPFDLEAPIIKIEDEDYGLWYIDAVEHVDKYVGKTVKFKGMVYLSSQFPNNYFVPGRFAMTCCAEDTAFIGFLCSYNHTKQLKNRQWIMVTAEVRCEYQKQYDGEGPVLYAKEIALTKEPEEKLVYFS